METLRLNNEAASLAAQEKQEEAAVCLQQALSALRDSVEMVCNSEPMSFDQVESSCIHHCDASTAWCQHQAIDIFPTSTRSLRFAPDGSGRCFEGAFEFYDKIFLVAIDETKSGACSGSYQSQWQQNVMLAAISKSVCLLDETNNQNSSRILTLSLLPHSFHRYSIQSWEHYAAACHETRENMAVQQSHAVLQTLTCNG